MSFKGFQKSVVRVSSPAKSHPPLFRPRSVARKTSRNTTSHGGSQMAQVAPADQGRD